MPNTTFIYMSWNIQTYGPGKWYANQNERVDAIAWTIHFSGASLVSIMELNATLAAAILTSIANRLNALRGTLNAAPDWVWESVTGNVAPSTGSDEAYGFLYRTGVLTAADSPNGTTVSGRSTTDRQGNPLKFPTRSSSTGNGRKPAYCAFRENAGNKLFSVVTYHAPYSAQAIVGTRSMGMAREAYEVNLADPGTAPNWTAVTASLISGDFNINYPSAFTYGAIQNAPPNGPGGTATIFENSTVRAFDPNPPYPPYWAPAVWWRVSSYDNIFCTANATPGASGILDVLSPPLPR